MSGYLGVKNWEKFQHYADRDPKWVKLYRGLLDDYEFTSLPDESRAHLIGIWLLAAMTNNRIPNDSKWIANRINATTPVDLDRLIQSGFLFSHDSVPSCYGSASKSVHREEKRREEKSISYIKDLNILKKEEIEEEEERSVRREEEEVCLCAEPKKTLTHAPEANQSLELEIQSEPSKPIIEFPTAQTGITWWLTKDKVDEWQQTYPSVHILGEMRKARQWLEDNPTRRKTNKGMPRFLNSWLSRAINTGKAATRFTPQAQEDESGADFIREFYRSMES